MNTAPTLAKTEYPSRVDIWLAATLIGTPLLILGAGVMMLRWSIIAGGLTVLTALTVGGLMAVLSYPCVYSLTDRTLTIRAGWLQDELALRQIRGAEKITSVWSAPALSVHRVKILLVDGTRTISPHDRDGFIADLNARLAQLKTAN